MAQISLPTRFCTACGAIIVRSHPFCEACGKEVDMRYSQPNATTVEITGSAADKPINNYIQDTDATVRAATRVSARFYAAAARQDRASQSAAMLAEEVDEPTQQRLSAPLPRRAGTGKRRLVQVVCSSGALLLIFLLVSGIFGYSAYADAQQQAGQSKSQLDRLIQKAQNVGVPASSLQPILAQEQQFNNPAQLLTLFPNLAGTNIDQYQAQQYRRLQTQIPAIITTATQQFQLQAESDLQSFQTALAKAEMQPVGDLHAFSQQFSQNQLAVASAHLPKDYAAISGTARQSIAALALLASTNQQLIELNDTLAKLQAAHLDVTALQTQYQHDVAIFNTATLSSDFQNLSEQLDAQYQQLLVISVQAFPDVSATKLNELTEQVQALHTYGLDAGVYQQRLDADQVAQTHAVTLEDDLVFFKQVNTDIAAMRNDLAKGEAHYQVTQFQQEVDAWGQAHLVHDSYDGHDFMLDNGYMKMGIGGSLASDLEHAHSLSDNLSVIAEAQNALFDLHLLEADYADQTPFDQVHPTDLQMLEHYQLQKKQVLMVSLAEQALRVYQNGSLVRSYQVTTGRQELPSLPGVWSVLDRKTSIIFTAGEPRSSPFWFPDTLINYAILYHYGGYYVHDAPWRANFGPGTQFPHQDDSGTTAYNFDGSHGCINVAESATAWIYNNTDWNTVIAIY